MMVDSEDDTNIEWQQNQDVESPWSFNANPQAVVNVHREQQIELFVNHVNTQLKT